MASDVSQSEKIRLHCFTRVCAEL